MNSRILTVGTILVTANLSFAAAEDIGRSQAYQGIDNVTRDLSADISELGSKANKVTVSRYSQHQDIPYNLRDYVLRRFEAVGQSPETNKVNFIRCVGCFTPKAITKGDQIFVRKGFQNRDELVRYLDKMKVNHYAETHVDFNDDELVLQVSVMSKDSGSVVFAKEYRTHVHGPDRSGIVIGFGAVNGMYTGSKIPNLPGGRVSFGQRLVGLGDVGITGSSFGAQDGMPPQGSAGFYSDLNLNEMAELNWDYTNLIFPVHIGVTDFNGDIQAYLETGFKLRVGSTFYSSLTARGHTFVAKPKHEEPLIKNNDRDEEESFLASDKPIPMAILLGFGFDFVL